jgi:hypothetical protein
MWNLIASLVSTMNLSLPPEPAHFVWEPLDDRVTWKCQDPQWIGEPSVDSGDFDATIAVVCSVQGSNKGGLVVLRDFLYADLEKNALQIFGGPTPETYQGLSGHYYDATLPINEEGVDSVRADYHIATDGKTRLVAGSRSKEITASGIAKNVKTMDSECEVTPQAQAGNYSAKVTSHGVVSKPALIGYPKFKSIAMSRMKQALIDHEERLMTELGNHL